MPHVVIPVPPRFSHLLRYVRIEVGTAGEALIPASPFPTLCIVVDGGFAVEMSPGHWRHAIDAVVAGPITRPFRSLASPPVTFVMAFFHPGGTSHLFDVPLHEATNSHIPLDALVGTPNAGALVRRMRDGTGPSQWTSILLDWIADRLARREGRGSMRGALPLSSIFLPGAYLAEQHGLSLRQFERRFLAVYGQSLRDMRRSIRYVNVLGRIMRAPPARGELARIAQDAGYFDQAHLNREFSALTGLSPGQYARALASDPAMRLVRYEDHELAAVLDRRGDSLLELVNP